MIGCASGDEPGEDLSVASAGEAVRAEGNLELCCDC